MNKLIEIYYKLNSLRSKCKFLKPIKAEIEEMHQNEFKKGEAGDQFKF